MSDIIKELSEHDIYRYGSAELLKFEKQMERFSRIVVLIELSQSR
jgi:hypothetical protein